MKLHNLAVLCCLLFLATMLAASHKHHHSAGSGTFNYYLLSLSWAPSYCAEHPSDHSRECSTHSTFVLHGLWPQSENGAPPMDCGGGAAPSDIVDHMLKFMPSRGLIQHEWSKHGTCSGLSPDDYFHHVEQAFTSVQVPEPYRNLTRETNASVSDLEKNFAAANHAPQQSFRISCHSGELVGVEVCLDKNLGYRSCTASARECSSGSVTIQSPRE